MARTYGVTLLVDTVKMIVAFSTSIIAGLYGALVLKAPIAGTAYALTSAWVSGVSIFFGLVFLFYVAERNIKGTEPVRWASYLLIALCWLPFLVGVGYAAAFGFEVARVAA